MSRVTFKYRLVRGARLLLLVPWFVMEANLKSQGYSASENMFIEVLLLRDIVLVCFAILNSSFAFCRIFKGGSSRRLTQLFSRLKKASHMLRLVRCISCGDIVTLLETL